MEDKERKVKGIWIPIEIWEDENLSWNEKILFLEIDSFTTSDVDCYFSNKYISELLGISETNANKTLSSLIHKGYVIKTRFDGRRRYIRSALSISTSQPCQYRQPCLVENDNPAARAHVTNSNNNILINKINKTNNKEENIIKEEKEDELFNIWWSIYDKKVGLKKCKEKWKKLSQSTKQKIISHTREYVASTPNKQYRKMPLTYLNGESWNDEIIHNVNTSLPVGMILNGDRSQILNDAEEWE